MGWIWWTMQNPCEWFEQWIVGLMFAGILTVRYIYLWFKLSCDQSISILSLERVLLSLRCPVFWKSRVCVSRFLEFAGSPCWRCPTVSAGRAGAFEARGWAKVSRLTSNSFNMSCLVCLDVRWCKWFGARWSRDLSTRTATPLLIIMVFLSYRWWAAISEVLWAQMVCQRTLFTISVNFQCIMLSCCRRSYSNSDPRPLATHQLEPYPLLQVEHSRRPWSQWTTGNRPASASSRIDFTEFWEPGAKTCNRPTNYYVVDFNSIPMNIMNVSANESTVRVITGSYWLPVWGWACSTRNRWCADCAASGTSGPLGGDQTEAERVLQVSEEILDECWDLLRSSFIFFHMFGAEGVEVEGHFKTAGGFDANGWSNHPKYLCGGKKNLVVVHCTYSLSRVRRTKGISWNISYAFIIFICGMGKNTWASHGQLSFLHD